MYQSPLVHKPSDDALKKIAADLGLDLKSEEFSDYRGLIDGLLDGYQALNEYPEPIPAVKYPRTPGYRPGPVENPCNAWYWKTDIRGASVGKLVGKTLGIKDNVAVAGVPMMNGSKILEGYTPEFDATVVTRILDEGGRILGKTACEDMCCSAGRYTCTCSTGAVLNPHSPGHSAGGSSSGNAALLSRGNIDLAIGGDQGGSIRLPASWSGIVGLKPTYGLVPYTGAIPMEMTLDHLGPMARNVKDCALLLELSEDLTGVRVGRLLEGFKGITPEVNACVLNAIDLIRKAGASVDDVSIPVHAKAQKLVSPIANEGCYQTMFYGHALGSGWQGFYPTSLQQAVCKGIQTRPNDLSVTMKMVCLMGEYMRQNYQNKFYSKSQNVRRTICQQYEEALKTFDVLVMPTSDSPATRLPSKDATAKEMLGKGFSSLANTQVFNVTGHPAISVNAGFSAEGLPIGLQIVGRRFEDGTVLKIAYAFEQKRDG